MYPRPAESGTTSPLFVRWFADAETAPSMVARRSAWRWRSSGSRTCRRQGKTDYHFVICRLTDDEPIGTAGLHDLDLVNGNAEFGISIGEKSEWNQGYGTDALHAICDFGFGELRLERIELEVYASNARASGPYEKAGFALGGDAPPAALRRGAARGRADHGPLPRRVGGAGSAPQPGS